MHSVSNRLKSLKLTSSFRKTWNTSGNDADTDRCYEVSYTSGILTFKLLIHKNISEMSLAL